MGVKVATTATPHTAKEAAGRADAARKQVHSGVQGETLEDMRSGGMMQGVEHGLPIEDTRERGRLTYGICDCKRRPNMREGNENIQCAKLHKTKKKSCQSDTKPFFLCQLPTGSISV